HAHNAWDIAEVGAFGGGCDTPIGQGSGVAGSGTGYSKGNSGGTGPWNRIEYPGSLLTVVSPLTGGVPAGSGYPAGMTSSGTDVTPANPLPWTSTSNRATAVRFALGDIRIGRPAAAEVTLRVMSTSNVALDSNQDLVDCGEVFGSDTAEDAPSGVGNGSK